MTDSLNETIGLIAQDVYEELGSGQTESVYQCAMEVGLRLAKLKYESQKVVEVKYHGHYVGRGAADLVVWSRKAKIVVELKSVDLGTPEEKQLENYMKVLKVKEGLLISFPQPGRAKNPKTEKKLQITNVSL
jgi:GxxExxY protein